MIPALVLLALLCPVGEPDSQCTPDTATVYIAHPAPPGTPCDAALQQLMLEAAASPVQGGDWRFSCEVR